MAQVQALIIVASDDGRTVSMARRVGELMKIEAAAAVVVVAGEEIRVPVHLVWELDRPDILQSAVAQLSAEVVDDRACLHAAVGEVIERAEPEDYARVDTDYTVPGEDFERMRDAWARARDTPGKAA